MTTRRSTDQRLADLARKKKQIDAQIEALENRTGSERRQIENRAVWLLGRLLRDRMAEDVELQAWARDELRPRLTDRDWSRGVWEVLFLGDDEAAR